MITKLPWLTVIVILKDKGIRKDTKPDINYNQQAPFIPVMPDWLVCKKVKMGPLYVLREKKL